MVNKIFKYQSYAQLANSDIWKKYLKPDLQLMIERESLSEGEPTTEFEACKRDIKRVNSLRIVNEIIRLIERADNKINKQTYGREISVDDDRRG